jgi:type IV pilus assembly protein PilQ
VQSLSYDRRQVGLTVNAAAGENYVRGVVVMYEKIKKYSRNCTWVLLAISLCISPLTAGAQQGGLTSSNTAQEKLRTRITVNYANKPLEEALLEFADKADINIIKHPEVSGSVTVKLTDIPLEEALANILALYNYTYIATENMVRVIPLPPQAEVKEPQVTRIYKITYADANTVYDALDNFISGKAEIGFNKGTNHIMVTDTEDKIRPIDKFIEQIDQMTSQVLVEVRVYDVTTKEGFELDPQWRIGRNAPYTYDTIFPADEVETTNYRQEILDWQEMPIALDPANPTYWADPNKAITVDTQVEDSWTTQKRYEYDQPIRTNWSRKPFVGGSFDRVTGGALRFSILNDAIDLNFVLSILHSQVEARLLANPRILVVDNEPAKFEIVREFPYRELLQVTREDPMSYTDFKKVGVDLKVTPHIARDGMMRLHIEPEFSVLVSREALSVLRGSDDLGRMTYHTVLGVPVVDSRRLETTAMIKDGQTIAIGGLRKREVTKNVARVPLLCNIPLVGGLFTSESESVAINELIVFITATIITDSTLSESEQKLLGETAFTTPQLKKTKIEKGEFKTTRDGEPDEVGDSLDLLLQKLGPSGE